MVFVKLLPTDVRPLNTIVRFVTVTLFKVIESTKIVKLDIEEKKVVLVIVTAVIEGRKNKVRTNKNIGILSFFLFLPFTH